jgi:Uma2 family endonuclease
MAIRAEDLPHFTVEQYVELCVADGSMGRTELVDGVILSVSPESWVHAQAVRFVGELLNQVHPGRSQRNGSVRFADASLWEPDVFVLRPGVEVTGTYPLAGDLELVVEVALNTKARDLGDKLDVYAAHEIPVYWVVMPTSPGWALMHHTPVGGRYSAAERIELPDGYRSFDVSTFER